MALRLVDRTRHRVIASSRHRVIVPSCTSLVVFGAFHTSDIIGIDWCTRNERLSYGTREDTRVCALSETCARSPKPARARECVPRCKVSSTVILRHTGGADNRGWLLVCTGLAKDCSTQENYRVEQASK